MNKKVVGQNFPSTKDPTRKKKHIGKEWLQMVVVEKIMTVKTSEGEVDTQQVFQIEVAEVSHS